ncbi:MULTISPECIES: type I polyketide synthase [unclassified Corynebacterium]|uniref:type I polyketide synthase n=1 Tax=Corynebacterium TaxID=1716 RepID=UPI00254A854D|nr:MULTISPECIES: type I polyketide synthase [unclassified Corynebacterium]MDK8468291.1 beta-ketoacyl synthase N-terminal-like domain-containing protein [Corynebacterium sp. MSK130]MDK8688836.1 beta-ketoacyl synthase N-terminal-like domain-containing protein [Corynebacterium sp. MSK122]MDK8705293.1 beta-ketoacyl synthase N-terminal-like domain-containing protein [Corynebacterium sp. MSK090]MDK8831383.1 beta-ketoacyl synthase N-terminal-like domain-containing protein [Corynebacterium sp. MSK072]
MTIEQLRAWLRDWVSQATGVAATEILDSTPLENYGLSSRDAVVLSGELENLLGTRLDATVAYEYPTIELLANRLLNEPAGRHDDAPRVQRTARAAQGSDIAVIGLSGRFPGAKDVPEFWTMLAESRAGTGPLPVGRWSEYSADPVLSEKIAQHNTDGGYIDDVASFDAEFFGLSPLEAANMDPQQRILLELVWHALENAGLPANELRGTHTGVYMGSTNNDYGMLITADPTEMHPYALTGSSSAIVANRISYALDFRGPSINVDTACSSSLVAVDHAIKDLRTGAADVALAGGVNILAAPHASTAFSELGVTSPTSAIHAFSDDADGIVRADAAGVLVLKRLEDAEADGDEILAVLKGSAVNSDGHSNGLTAPNPEAQEDVLRRAYADAGVAPEDVDYVEAHGTGTILGDPIEASALGRVLGTGRGMESPVLLGSAKTNIGHSESAAGVVGLIKVIEAMRHDIIPANINYSGPNRYIDFVGERLEVVEDPREWPEYSGKKVAGVSGFGFGGTNAHVVLTDYQGTPRTSDPQLSTGTVALPVSGLLPSRRARAAGLLADFLEAEQPDLADVARTVARRNHSRSRAVVMASSTEEAIKRLRQVAEGKVSVGIAAADSPQVQGPVFVYSGFGSQHRKMAKDMIALSPLFSTRLKELDAIVDFESGWSILGIVEDDSQTYDTETAQVAITAIQIALTDLLASFGVRPAGVMGMSMGEIAAAYAAGGISARDAMIIACHRARLMGEGEASLSDAEQGAMAVVELSAEDIAALDASIEPAVYTGPGMTTVGGPRQAVLELVEKLDDEGKFARALNVKAAGHTSAVDPILGELEAAIAGMEARPLHTTLFSSVDKGEVYRPGTTVHDEDYWLRMTRYPVYLQDATEQAFAAGHTQLVEISPNPVALMGLMSTAFAVGKADAQLLYSLKRKVDPTESLLDLLSKLYVTGTPVNFAAVVGSGSQAEAPYTQFNRQRFWTNARPSAGVSGLPGNRVNLPEGKVAFSTNADQAPSTLAIVEAAAEAVQPGAHIVAAEEHRDLPPYGEITTVVTTSIGGMSIAVYSVQDTRTELLAEGFASGLDLGAGAIPGVAAVPEGNAGTETAAEEEDVDAVRWDPRQETVEDRLALIVSESMGYDVSDLPRELPLIDLGLDSLMGMRIKNRVENDFQIPPLQVQALRDASLADVITMVEEAVAGGRLDNSDASADAAPAATESAPAADETAEASEQGVGIAPRDASERMVFGTWASITGKAPAGVTSPLPEISEEVAAQIAERLRERAHIDVTAQQVLDAEALETLSDLVREGLETEVEGNIRVLREADGPAVFMFHPAGGTTVVYQPLTRRLPADVAVYGVERIEGSLEERAAAYIEDIVRYARGRKVVLGGWSFGGALAYEVAYQLAERSKRGEESAEVAFISLLDTTQPSHPAPDTLEETRARWERYAAFAKKTYGLDFEPPYEMLDTMGEDALMTMLAEFLATTDASEHGLSAGVLEHQRASFVDNQILAKIDFHRWADVSVPVLLFRSERMHDGAIELEPRYAEVDPDGGWGVIVKDLDIVQLPGDHLAVPDEPAIGTVGKHMNDWIEEKIRGGQANNR